MADESPQNDPAAGAPPAVTSTDDAPVNGTAPQATDNGQRDTPMADAPFDQPASSPAPAVPGSSPVPARTGTPTQSSRAPSAHPDPGPSIPTETQPHGDSTRRYLNLKVTGVLLEGVKQVAKDKPNDPLRVLGEYLIQKSKELEETS